MGESILLGVDCNFHTATSINSADANCVYSEGNRQDHQSHRGTPFSQFLNHTRQSQKPEVFHTQTFLLLPFSVVLDLKHIRPMGLFAFQILGLAADGFREKLDQIGDLRHVRQVGMCRDPD